MAPLSGLDKRVLFRKLVLLEHPSPQICTTAHVGAHLHPSDVKRNFKDQAWPKRFGCWRCCEIELTCHSHVVFGCHSGRPDSQNYFSAQIIFGHLGAWFTSASSPKYSPCFTWAFECLRYKFLKADANLVDSLLVPGIPAHFLEDNQGAGFDKVHPISTISLHWRESVSRKKQKIEARRVATFETFNVQTAWVELFFAVWWNVPEAEREKESIWKALLLYELISDNPNAQKLAAFVWTCLLDHLLPLRKSLADEGVCYILPLVFLQLYFVFCICIYAFMSFVIIQQPVLKNWKVLEVSCGIWLARQSLQSATGSLRTLLTSRCFKRETFSRKDSYIFRFWNALLRTIFLNVERSMAHRDPLVWAWVGWTGVNCEEERRVARI